MEPMSVQKSFGFSRKAFRTIQRVADLVFSPADMAAFYAGKLARFVEESDVTPMANEGALAETKTTKIKEEEEKTIIAEEPKAEEIAAEEMPRESQYEAKMSQFLKLERRREEEAREREGEAARERKLETCLNATKGRCEKMQMEIDAKNRELELLKAEIRQLREKYEKPKSDKTTVHSENKKTLIEGKKGSGKKKFKKIEEIIPVEEDPFFEKMEENSNFEEKTVGKNNKKELEHEKKEKKVEETKNVEKKDNGFVSREGGSLVKKISPFRSICLFGVLLFSFRR